MCIKIDILIILLLFFLIYDRIFKIIEQIIFFEAFDIRRRFVFWNVPWAPKQQRKEKYTR
jgi:hypothetical protein